MGNIAVSTRQRCYRYRSMRNLGKLTVSVAAVALSIVGIGVLSRSARKVSASSAALDVGSRAVGAISVSSGNYVNIVNGQPWPLNFDPFCNNSAKQCPWNNPLPDNPTLMANSAGLVSGLFASSGGGLISSLFGSRGGMTGLPDAAIEGGSREDFAHPVYLASKNDPLVTLGFTCGTGAGTTGARIHIPAKARPTASSDAHMGVIQPDGEEWDFWSATGPGRDWQDGDTINCKSSGGHSNIVSGSGSLLHSATSGAALSAGNLRVNELNNGWIPHALFVVVKVGTNGYVYPGQSNATQGGSIPIGARLQLKYTDAQIDAMAGLQPWEKTLLHQMHDYGLYVLDTGGDGWVTYKWESPTQYTSFGGTNPGEAWVSANKPPATWRPNGINWATDLVIVDPCYAEGTCTQSHSSKKRDH